MKTEFPILVKAMRLVLRPEFKSIVDKALTPEQQDEALVEIEKKSLKIIVENGYTEEEFYALHRQYLMDFSSENPDEWVIKHDPENAQIITGK